MVKEAEEFAAEDEIQRKRIEALNSLTSIIYTVKTQLSDDSGLGGKIDDDDRKTLQDAIREAQAWVESDGHSATTEDLEEKLVEFQAIVNPITSKLYEGGPGAGYGDDGDQEPFMSHDEL